MFLRRCFAILTLFSVSLFCSAADKFTHIEKPFTGVKTDVVIGTIGDTTLLIDIALPVKADASPRPTVVLIHGGGLISGDKNKFAKHIRKFAERGIIAASVNYRLAPEHRFPAAIEDVKTAIRFLKAHSKPFNLDPDRIIVSGVSSGAYLAVMIGVTGNATGFSKHNLYTKADSKVRAVVAQAGHIADFSKPEFATFTTVERFINTNYKDRNAALKDLSPSHYLDKDDPPFFLSHGTADERVPVTMTRDFVNSLKAIDHDYEYIEVEGGKHSLSESQPQMASKVFRASQQFIKRHAYPE